MSGNEVTRKRGVRADMQAVRDRDPALPEGLRGTLEIILCYPGFQAVVAHRLLHFLHARLHIPILPRFLAHIVRWWTGIEIHPGARIGRGVFIDHGMGVVIGETAVVGDDVTLYQGVTLGGTGKEKGKRHPTVEAGALIGGGAKVLGNIVVGRNARIGAGSVVVHDVPPGATVVGVPGVVVRHYGRPVQAGPGKTLAHGELPEPLLKRLEDLEKEIMVLKARLAEVAGSGGEREVA
jgi:serine O-acetyltransferase